MSIQIRIGDCRDVLKTLPDESVHCCVTSPPYFGLRDYGTAKWEGGDPACEHKGRNNHDHCGDVGQRNADGNAFRNSGRYVNQGNAVGRQCHCGARRIDSQIGLEPTPDAFIAEMVAVFREVRRVLRKDGTCWLNMGDCYNANQGAGFNGNAGKPTSSPKLFTGLPPKNLLMMPARVALALQADGWWLRSHIIWHKPNPMPESVTDRPTSAHESVFLLTRSARYWYDADAVREAVSENSHGNTATFRDNSAYTGGRTFNNSAIVKRGSDGRVPNESGLRNLRNVWTIPSAPYSGAHFATFPPALIEPAIKAGCPDKCCPHCGAGWERQTETVRHKDPTRHTGRAAVGCGDRMDGDEPRMIASVKTLGFAPTCTCPPHEPIPGTVLDPFGGAGTTGLVADRLGRNAILIELNPDYAGLADNRIVDDLPLFSDVVTA